MKPTPQTDDEAAEEQRNKEREEADRRLTQRLAIGTVIVGALQILAIGFQVGIALQQNRIIKKQSAIMEGQKTAAETQSTIAREQKEIAGEQTQISREQKDIAAEQRNIAAGQNKIGRRQNGIAQAQNAINRVVERAYVSMADIEPGVIRSDDFVLTGQDMIRRRQFEVAVTVTNHGNTPATVTDVTLEPYFGFSLPTTPPYSNRVGYGKYAYLAKGEKFVQEFDFSVLADHMEAAEGGGTMLYIIGYVDYRDRFGERHRSGYARVFNGSATKQHDLTSFNSREINVRTVPAEYNLMVVVEPGYNYDRPRVKGEGNDWNES